MFSFLSCFQKPVEPDTWVRGSTAIVTGGNSGIGEATVKQLRKFGVDVIIACRDVEKGQKAIESIIKDQGEGSEYGKLSIMKLDVNDFQSIRDFAKQFAQTHHKLEILVNNAGVSMNSKRLDEKTNYSVCFQTNYLGPVYLTKLLKPYLIAAKQARIVNLSSVYHRFADNNFELALQGKHENAYKESKLALTLFGRELQRRFALDNINHVKVVNANPGGVSSNIWRRYSAYMRCFVRLLLLTPEQGCMSSVYGAVSKDINGGEYVSVNYIPSKNHSLMNLFDLFSFYAGYCVAEYGLNCTAASDLALWEKTEQWIENVDKLLMTH